VLEEEKEEQKEWLPINRCVRVCIVSPDLLVGYLVRYLDLSVVPDLISVLYAEKTVDLSRRSLCFFIFNLARCVGC
jgi:hypothetical protein